MLLSQSERFLAGLYRLLRAGQKTWPWLEFKGKHVHCIWCSICKQYSTASSNLSHGKDNTKKDSVEKHGKNRENEIALSVKQAKETSAETPMAVSIQGMEKDVLERILKVFNTNYYIAKKELPFTLFPSVIELQCKKGLSFTFRVFERI